MPEQQPIDPDDPRPTYVRIADSLREAYDPGKRLPTAAKIASDWGGVAKATVERAIDVLRSEGLIVSWQGRGVFYKEKPPARADHDDSTILQRLEEIMDRLDSFEGRLSALEHPQEPGASQ